MELNRLSNLELRYSIPFEVGRARKTPSGKSDLLYAAGLNVC